MQPANRHSRQRAMWLSAVNNASQSARMNQSGTAAGPKIRQKHSSCGATQANPAINPK